MAPPGVKEYSYPGVGEMMRRDFWYSTAVRVGDRIECAGQGELRALV